MAEKHLVKAPPRIVRATYQALYGPELSAGTSVELVIRTHVTDVQLREFANYFWLVDRFYGRLDPSGLRSYAQRRREQLRIRRAKLGSLEFSLIDAVDFASPQNLALLWMVLRGIPLAGRTLSEMVRNYASAYRDYEEGRLARVRRQQLGHGMSRDDARTRLLRRQMRKFVREDSRFEQLPPHRSAELARVLADAYLADEDHVKSVRKFAEVNVQTIMLRIGDSEI